MTAPLDPRQRRLRLIAFALLASAFMVAFFHRVAPTVIVDELREDLNASAVALGWLGAVYFYVYTAMQIPAGILADRYGPRLSVAGGCLVAAGGSLLFAAAGGLLAADAGRLLVGLGVSTAFVGLMKFNANWFDARQYARMAGVVILIGNAGAVLGVSPLARLLNWVEWREAFVGLALISLLLAVAIFLVVRDRPASATPDHGETGAAPREPWWSSLAAVASNRALWPHFTGLFAVVGSFFAFSGLWAVPMFHDVFALDRTSASDYVTLSLVAFALGSFAAGWVSDRLGHRKPVIVAAAVLSLLTYLYTWMGPWAPGASAWWLFLAHGLCPAGMVVCYTAAKESVSFRHTGMAIALVNTGLFLGAAVLQPAFGWLLESQAVGDMLQHADYRRGLALLCLINLVGLAATLLGRETGGLGYREDAA